MKDGKGHVLLKQCLFLFSAPEPKAQVHYCDHALSVVSVHVELHRSFGPIKSSISHCWFDS